MGTEPSSGGWVARRAKIALVWAGVSILFGMIPSCGAYTLVGGRAARWSGGGYADSRYGLKQLAYQNVGLVFVVFGLAVLWLLLRVWLTNRDVKFEFDFPVRPDYSQHEPQSDPEPETKTEPE